MGVLATVCGKIHPSVGWGFKLGKLAFRLWEIGPRPVKLVEKTAVFVVGCVNGKLAMGYYVARIVLFKVVNSKRTEGTLQAIHAVQGGVPTSVHGLVVVSMPQLEAALTQSGLQQQQQQQLKELTMRQRAAIMFAEEVLLRCKRGSPLVSRNWVVKLAGEQLAFDEDGLRACLKSFFSTDAGYQITRQLRHAYKQQGKEVGSKHKVLTITPSMRSAIAPLADDALLEIKTALRDDAIDLFLL